MFDERGPVFLLELDLDVMYIDGHGQTSRPLGLPPQSFYDPHGYFMFRVDGDSLHVNWLGKST
jgi:hypothetical protein